MRRPAFFASFFVASLVLFAFPESAHAEERKESNAASLGKMGLVMFGSTYGYAAVLGAASYRVRHDDVATQMFIPVVGPLLLLKNKKFDESSLVTVRMAERSGVTDCDRAFCAEALLFVPFVLVEYGMMILGPLAQATGLAMAVGGLAQDHAVSERESSRDEARTNAPSRPKVSVKPTTIGTAGAGVALSITEW